MIGVRGNPGQSGDPEVADRKNSSLEFPALYDHTCCVVSAPPIEICILRMKFPSPVVFILRAPTRFDSSLDVIHYLHTENIQFRYFLLHTYAGHSGILIFSVSELGDFARIRYLSCITKVLILDASAR